jgi:hypothetical protein
MGCNSSKETNKLKKSKIENNSRSFLSLIYQLKIENNKNDNLNKICYDKEIYNEKTYKLSDPELIIIINEHGI